MQRRIDGGDGSDRNVKPGLDDRAHCDHLDLQAGPRPDATLDVGTIERRGRLRHRLRGNRLVQSSPLRPEACQHVHATARSHTAASRSPCAIHSRRRQVRLQQPQRVDSFASHGVMHRRDGQRVHRWIVRLCQRWVTCEKECVKKCSRAPRSTANRSIKGSEENPDEQTSGRPVRNHG
jgi:hypothetical protein